MKWRKEQTRWRQDCQETERTGDVDGPYMWMLKSLKMTRALG